MGLTGTPNVTVKKKSRKFSGINGIAMETQPDMENRHIAENRDCLCLSPVLLVICILVPCVLVAS